MPWIIPFSLVNPFRVIYFDYIFPRVMTPGWFILPLQGDVILKLIPQIIRSCLWCDFYFMVSESYDIGLIHFAPLEHFQIEVHSLNKVIFSVA